MVLTAVALGLWSYSLFGVRLEIGYYGLLQGLPPAYPAALGLLTVASAVLWTRRQDHGRLLALQLVFLVAGLWLVPAVTGASAPFEDHAYRNLRLIDHILRHGHFSPQEAGYFSWPGPFITLYTAMGSIPGDARLLTALYPLAAQLLLLVPLVAFLRNTLGRERPNLVWAGAWLFCLASWTGRQYLASAPGLALLLLLTLLALLTFPPTWERTRRGYLLLGLAVVVTTALAVTHLLTSLAAVLITGAVILLKKRWRLLLVPLLCAGLVVGWNLTGSERGTILDATEPEVVAPGEPLAEAGAGAGSLTLPDGNALQIPAPGPIVAGRALVLSPDVFVATQVTGHIAGSESHIAVSNTRLVLSGLLAAAGLAGAGAALWQRRGRSTAVLVLGLAAAPLPLAIIPYGGRALDHLYVFALAPMAYFAARLLARARPWVTTTVCLLAVAAIPLHLAAHYGNARYDYFPASLTSGYNFAYAAAGVEDTLGTDYPWATLEPPRQPFTTIAGLTWQDGLVLAKGIPEGDGAGWLYLEHRHHAYYDFLLGAPEFLGRLEGALESTANCQVTYLNPDFKLYRLAPAADYR